MNEQVNLSLESNHLLVLFEQPLDFVNVMFFVCLLSLQLYRSVILLSGCTELPMDTKSLYIMNLCNLQFRRQIIDLVC